MIIIMDILNYTVFTSCYFFYFKKRKKLFTLFTHFNMTSTSDLGKNKRKVRRPLSIIWEDITKGDHVGSEKYQATCKYCNFSWPRGDISKLEEHLANHCSEASVSTVRKYLTKVLEREDKASKKRRADNNQLTMTDYHDSMRIPSARVIRINRALAKFFVACGISFRVVKHPFFVNFVKNSTPHMSYQLENFYQINYSKGS